jgi:phospholipase C
MIRPLFRRFPLLKSFAFASILLASTATFAQVPEPLTKVGHVVVIFEENRSFDSMFGHFPGANGLANAGDHAIQIGPDGKPYQFLPHPIDSHIKAVDPRFPANLPNQPFDLAHYVAIGDKTGDLIHAFYQEQMQINNGMMNRYAAVSDAAGLVMGYYDTSKTELWKLAEQFTLGDAMFHSAFGGSFLNHSFLVCSCAFRYPDAPASMVSQVGPDGTMIKNGQVTPDGYAVNTSQSVYLHDPKQTDTTRLIPPQTMPHIGDRLDAKGVNWAWYSGGYDDAMAGKPDPLFQFHHQALAYFQNLAPGTPGQKAHLKDYKDFVRDIQAGSLPPVVFYKPIGENNEHPGYAEIATGDRHLAELIAMLQKSPDYKDMLIIITYDENGGSWDHVSPPRRDKWGPGTRVPLIAVGPMVKNGYVDHTPYDFGSILKTIELRFGAAPVNEIDGNAYPMVGLLK